MELLRNLTIGQYVPRPSAVHRLDPRTKILATTAVMVVVFAVRDFAGFGVFAVLLVALIAVSRIPPAFVVRGLRPIWFLLLLTLVLQIFFGGQSGGTVLARWGPFVATHEGLMQGLFVTARLVLLVVATSMLTFTTSPVELADGMERLLNPFRRIGVPAHELAMMTTIALRFIPTLVEETEKIMKAQMARGAELDTGGPFRRARALIPILVPLFVSAFRRADELALAMEARCYRGGEGRTRMKQLRYRPADLAAGFVVLLASVAVLLPGRV
ncbi:MAG: energy-coupling factor transporter transmembrane component T [Armatimonadota bacterium]|nr:energy-coupling factor transporter transmembrane component T [Armatimonadota bacterium]MDR5697095.1 energy-coupling factor transporter transmembrane component T [Armatimonadota bacterium]